MELMTLILVVLGAGALAANSSYTTRYDNVNLDEILRNQRLYRKYLDCLLERGKCTPDGKELKDHLPEALENGCKKCSEKQRLGAQKVIKFLIENKMADFELLERIYDPQQIYTKKYRDEAKKDGILLP